MSGCDSMGGFDCGKGGQVGSALESIVVSGNGSVGDFAVSLEGDWGTFDDRSIPVLSGVGEGGSSNF